MRRSLFPHSFFRAAFTLIELLIVVAIIAILAAIALPNFLEAQTRSKVARTLSDLRTLATALESYHADERHYPPALNAFIPPNPDTETWRLTTPIAYLSSIPKDIFWQEQSFGLPGGDYGPGGEYIHYIADRTINEVWLMWSYGPDLSLNFEEVVYDPTNGSISSGEIYRTGAMP